MSPIEENVAAILRATIPLFPTPVITSFAYDLRIDGKFGGFFYLNAAQAPEATAIVTSSANSR